MGHWYIYGKMRIETNLSSFVISNYFYIFAKNIIYMAVKVFLLMILLHVIDDFHLQGILASMKQKEW